MRYVLGVLFLAVLLSPMVLRWAVGVSDQKALPKDVLTLVIVTPHSEAIRREFREAFSKYYQEKFGKAVTIDYRVYGGASEIKNVLGALRETTYKANGTYDIDLAWGGGDATFDVDLKPFLEGLALDPEFVKQVYPSPKLGGLKLYEESNPPLWYGTELSGFGIVFNRQVLKYLGVEPPARWEDLTDPRYAGWVVLADPTRSSSARTAFMGVVEHTMAVAEEQGRGADRGWAEGMGLIRQIASNVRDFNDGSGAIPALVSSGDVAAAMTIDFYARSQIQFVGEDRLGYVEPANSTVITPDPIGLLQGAPHRELAKQFVEFVLSEQGQQLWDAKVGTKDGPRLVSLRRTPIRQSVFKDMSDLADPVDPFAHVTSFNTSRARTATFSILEVMIQVSCIDVLNDLRATRAAILSSTHAAELDAKLAVFPFDQKEALRRLDEYRKVSPVEKLVLIRKWTSEFRDEYRALRDEAQK
ncbi:MAG TPA: extracellular solute-binding protein [Tepidisphaeraceae bacterium]|nr:extracellular solute-binding protein [Tepidisphaeraceae bacterium]